MKYKLLAPLALLVIAMFATALQAQVLPANVTTFIKTYSNYLTTGQQEDVVSSDLQITSDGGYIMLGSTFSETSDLSWLVKIDSLGNTQWIKEVGVLNNPPSNYALGLSVQETRDGGYVAAGGAIGGAASGECSPETGIQCALVEKLDSSGNIQWASVYTAGSGGGSYLKQIRQTSDGGYVAVGGTSSGEATHGALILRLNSTGRVLWQKVVGPSGSTLASFNQVVLTADGGFAILGETYVPQAGPGIQSVWVSKYTAVGVLQWQVTYNEDNGSQVPFSLAQTSDGGYVVSGTTTAGVPVGYDFVNALLVKLGSEGAIQWEKAYYAGGLSEVAYSVNQTADGGYVLAGEATAYTGCGGTNPWMSKVDASGNQLWTYSYYQSDNGCALSEYFATARLTTDGGIVAIGTTTDYQTGLHLFYLVKTNSDGLCSSGCRDIYPYVPATGLDISLVAMPPTLPATISVTPEVVSNSQTQVTTATVAQDCD